jgi:hypothetical protein
MKNRLYDLDSVSEGFGVCGEKELRLVCLDPDGDGVKDSAELLVRLIEEDVRVLIYAGEWDYMYVLPLRS